MTSVTTSEFGTWKSPISSKLATESSVAFQEIHLDNGPSGFKDTVFWSELRYDEGGRYVVCSRSDGQKDFTVWTPQDFNARTRVHEYGGGSFFVHNRSLYFSNYKDQRLYVQKSAQDAPQALTPADSGWRFADGEFSTKLNRIYSIREDHSGIASGATKEPVNTIVVINPHTQKQNILAKGADFYAFPRVSSDGKKICWMQWYHPNMPWNSTEIWVAELQENGDDLVEGTAKKVAGREGVSVMYCGWTPNNELLYISDETDWWNLYHVNATGEHTNISPKDSEIGGPLWNLGKAAYQCDPQGSGKILTSYAGKLAILDPTTKEDKPLDTGFLSHSSVQYSSDGKIYCEAGSSTQFPCIIRYDIQSGNVDILRKSRTVPVDDGYLSIPEAISWPTTDGKISHGYFYKPKNKDFKGPETSLPPLLVKVHGGPTSATSDTLNLKLQYYTSRGFSILDVNYRGSTGYGRKYRDELLGNWGICDLDDCCNGAKHLESTKQVDKDRLSIDGGSAGGYTTLSCLTFRDVFNAGASFYGVADIEVLAQETHKFESRYCDTMIGPYPERKDIYDERSPYKHVDQLKTAIVFFQGDEDEIVPPNQSSMMYEAVKAKGVPTSYVLFEGEQHGFRKAENIQKSLDGEFYFFAKVFGYEPADPEGEIPIDNLPDSASQVKS